MQSRECQVADWPAHKIRCKPVEMSPQKLELHFTVGRGGERITFKEDIPALLCQRDAPRELTSRFVSNLVDTREEQVLAQRPGQCLYCTKQATRLQTTLMITLHGSPPTVFAMGQPLCTKNRDSPCAIKSEEIVQQGLNDPNSPASKAEVYKRQ